LWPLEHNGLRSKLLVFSQFVLVRTKKWVLLCSSIAIWYYFFCFFRFLRWSIVRWEGNYYFNSILSFMHLIWYLIPTMHSTVQLQCPPRPKQRTPELFFRAMPCIFNVIFPFFFPSVPATKPVDWLLSF
jgi:hypothetical protein